MHPELLQALAKAKHRDLLDRGRAPQQPKVRLNHRSGRLARARKPVGSLLIWAGARLIDDEQMTLKLAQLDKRC
jgi:hypothetical protein